MAHSRFTDEQWDQVQKLMKECSLKALEKDRPHKIWCTEHDDCVEWVGDVAFSYEALSTCPEFALSGGHLKSLFAEGQKYAYDAAFLPGANESQHSQLQAFRGEFDAIIKSGRVVLDTVTVKVSCMQHVCCRPAVNKQREVQSLPHGRFILCFFHLMPC